MNIFRNNSSAVSRVIRDKYEEVNDHIEARKLDFAQKFPKQPIEILRGQIEPKFLMDLPEDNLTVNATVWQPKKPMAA